MKSHLAMTLLCEEEINKLISFLNTLRPHSYGIVVADNLIEVLKQNILEFINEKCFLPIKLYVAYDKSSINLIVVKLEIKDIFDNSSNNEYYLTRVF